MPEKLHVITAWSKYWNDGTVWALGRYGWTLGWGLTVNAMDGKKTNGKL